MYHCAVNNKRRAFASFVEAELFCNKLYKDRGIIIKIDVSNDDANRYNVVLRYTDGSVGYLDHRDRMSWSLRTAKKYCREVNQSLIAGRYAGCIYASVVEAG